ncbi:LysM peptidoglycan-binding domain-containing protein [Embleya scabrispora]|uniref:LysM peptidoglycan-binding domain-containing protein n=1 Tax=Embleya scabrispora TaxID=159449 RepID=UPI0005947998|nr:LysM peptidoglycan-binding domain-containing protein [Embleya scabrispora]MYS85417.1 LysM peptidoglycan-binding domain-containing protein [Streptomyces sp. SID5474]
MNATRPTPDRRPRAPIAPLRALASLVALAAVLAAMPTVLFLATRTLAPRFPDRDDLTFEALLERPADAGVAYVAALAVGWLAWAILAGSVLWEIPAALRGRTRRAVRGFRWSQRLAAFLLGGLALTMSGGPALAAHAAPVAAASAPAGVETTAQAAPAAPAVARGSAAPTGATYTVQRGDTLWDIAERTLGDGARWHEIAELNDGRDMGDGHTFRAADDIDVGWVLRMPAGARATTPAAAPESADPVAPAQGPAVDAPRTVTVRSGDTLSAIAQRELGDPDWTSLFEANRDRSQPDGGALTDPDVIETGWVLNLPTASDAQAAPAAPAAPDTTQAPPAAVPEAVPGAPSTRAADPGEAPGAGGATAAPSEQTPRAQTPPAQVPPAQVPQTRIPPAQVPPAQPPGEKPPVADVPAPPAQDPGARQPAPAETAQAPSPASTGAPATQPPATADAPAPPAQSAAPAGVDGDDDGDGTSSPVPIGIGVGALAGAGLIAAVGVRRRLQQRERRAHRRIALPAPGPAAYEQRLRAAERPEGAEFLDLALSTLGIELADVGRTMPAFTTGHLTVAGLELRLRTAEPPIAPFNAVDGDTTRWFCPVDAPLGGPERARVLPAPCPALTPIARTGIGEVLLDLESCPVTLLDGTPEEQRRILRTLAVALLTGPRSEDVSVTVVGLDDDLDSLPGQRVFRAASPAEALSRLAGWHDECTEVLAREYTPSARAARTIGAAPDTWPPEIVLSREPLDADAITALRRLEEHDTRTAWAVVAPAPTDVETSEHWYTLPAGPDPSTLPGIDGDVTVHRLSDEELVALVGIFTAAADTTGQPAPPPEDDEAAGDVGAETPPSVSTVPPATAAAGGALAAEAPGRGSVTVTTYGGPPRDGGAAAAHGAPTAVPTFPLPVGPMSATLPAKPSYSPTIGVAPPAGNDGDAGSAGDVGATGDPGPVENDLGVQGTERATVAAGEPVPPAEPEGDPGATDPTEASASVSTTASPSVAPFRSFLGSTEPDPTNDGGAPDVDPTSIPALPNEGDHADVSAWLDSLPTPDDEDAAWAQAWEETMAETSSRILPTISSSPKPSGSASAEAQPGLSGVPALPHIGPEIRVLGPVEIVGVGDPAEASKRARLTELAAFLVLNPGLGHNDVDAAIWPDSGSATNRHTAMSKLRRWLGGNPDGEPYLPMIGDAGYRFAPGVTCDWIRFQRLARKGMRLGPLGGPDLTTALSLVRGRPFGGTSPRRYIWAEYLRQDMTSSIVDVAARLGELRLRDGDVRGAKLALSKGLEVCPESEMLYRLMFRAAYLSGDIDELEAYAARLNRLLDDLGCDMEDDTIHLLRSLLEARRRSANSRAAG